MKKIINVEYQCYNSPCGDMLIGTFEDKLVLCDWVDKNSKKRVDSRLIERLNATLSEVSNAVIEETMTQLDQYFQGDRTEFDLPLSLIGTTFQQRVWEELHKIPYGQTISYLRLAGRMGIPKAVRAVANANGANPVSIIVPCHRVVGSNGKLGGYGGGLETKVFLLNIEQPSIFDIYKNNL
ncbi:cysteine methyltransferase [Porphyromonadaceae bacterium COT-184 OH4590]|nr:cysteine methyltransferase [Porphyromonadaceae bacterium COT-184 OH4590]